jgi:hypothetical protein
MPRKSGSISSKLNKLKDSNTPTKSNSVDKSIELIIIDDDTDNTVTAFLLPDETNPENKQLECDLSPILLDKKEKTTDINVVKENQLKSLCSPSLSPVRVSPYSIVNENVLLLSPNRPLSQIPPAETMPRKRGRKTGSTSSVTNKSDQENIENHSPPRLIRTRRMASFAKTINYKPKEDSNDDDESQKIEVYLTTRSRKRKQANLNQATAVSSNESVQENKENPQDQASEVDSKRLRLARVNKRDNSTPLVVIDQNIPDQEVISQEQPTEHAIECEREKPNDLASLESPTGNEQPEDDLDDKQPEDDLVTVENEIVTYQNMDEVVSHLLGVSYFLF